MIVKEILKQVTLELTDSEIYEAITDSSTI